MMPPLPEYCPIVFGFYAQGTLTDPAPSTKLGLGIGFGALSKREEPPEWRLASLPRLLPAAAAAAFVVFVFPGDRISDSHAEHKESTNHICYLHNNRRLCPEDIDCAFTRIQPMKLSSVRPLLGLPPCFCYPSLGPCFLFLLLFDGTSSSLSLATFALSPPLCFLTLSPPKFLCSQDPGGYIGDIFCVSHIHQPSVRH